MNAERLIDCLRAQANTQGGSARVPAGQVADLLHISRPTLMRAVQAAGDAIITMGQTRRRAYAARRSLRGNLAPLPVFRISRAGEPEQIGRLHLAHGHGCWFEGHFPGWPIDSAMRDGWFEGLPYPLQDMRPDGFLGRAFAMAHAPLLQVSEDPREWSDDDTLHALSLLGSDTVGDLIVGEAAYQRWARHRLAGGDPAPVLHIDRPQAYPRLAEAAMANGAAGSSAAGEFPKFTTTVHGTDTAPHAPGQQNVRHVLVKFSGSDDSPGSRRWADLLVCEHLALQTLAGIGVPAASSRILQAGQRTFLEVDRFDRHGAFGRSPLCSWQAIGNAFLGDAIGPWPEAGTRLRGQGLIGKADAGTQRTLALLWHFGKFIQNTDMHAGNLSFMPVDGQLQPAPAYDMLPMHHAPVRGVELPVRQFDVALPLPDTFDHARVAAAAAESFWNTASQDERISDAFRAVCAQAAEGVRRLRAVMDR